MRLLTGLPNRQVPSNICLTGSVRHRLLSVLQKIINNPQMPTRTRQRATSTSSLHRTKMILHTPQSIRACIITHLDPQLRVRLHMITGLRPPRSSKRVSVRSQMHRQVRVLSQEPGRKMLRHVETLTMPWRLRHRNVEDSSLARVGMNPNTVKLVTLPHTSWPGTRLVQMAVHSGRDQSIHILNVREPDHTRAINSVLHTRHQRQLPPFQVGVELAFLIT